MSKTKEQVQEILRKGECEVVFTKKDNTVREMRCTLHPAYLPVQEEGSGAKKPPNDEVVAVWDLDEQAWRSFRLDSLHEGYPFFVEG